MNEDAKKFREIIARRKKELKQLREEERDVEKEKISSKFREIISRQEKRLKQLREEDQDVR